MDGKNMCDAMLNEIRMTTTSAASSVNLPRSVRGCIAGGGWRRCVFLLTVFLAGWRRVERVQIGGGQQVDRGGQTCAQEVRVVLPSWHHFGALWCVFDRFLGLSV